MDDEALMKRITELEADQRRLEWMFDNLSVVQRSGGRIWVGFGLASELLQDEWREAIDAAMGGE